MDKAMRHRVNAGREALRNQRAFFRRQFGEVATEWKPDDTRVTFVDYAISEGITQELRKAFGGDAVLSEEAGSEDEVVEMGSKYAWVLDPVDGTNNYALGVPFCGISLALLKGGMPVYGLLYDAARDQLLEGGAGWPLLIDGRRHVRPAGSFDRRSGLMALHFPLPEASAEALRPLLQRYRVRSLGSAALQLAYVATGLLDGVVDERVRVWDIAAAVALLEAAGCGIRYLGESPFPVLRHAMNGPPVRLAAGSGEFLAVLENYL